jgi:hypothetical protein
MSPTQADKILGLPRRPTLGDASTAALISGIALGLLTKDWKLALAGGAVGGALANQKQPLELAVREYFKKKDWEVIFFYRAPRSIKVTFSYAPHAFWTVEATMPDDLNLSDEDRDDWLYGSLTTKELPKIRRKIVRLVHP